MSLKKQTFSAVRWTTMSMVGKTGLVFLQTVVLARLLTPGDFGLMAIVAALLAILGIFADLGFGKVIIHAPKLTGEQLSSLYWLNLLAATLLMCAMAGFAPLIGWMYGEPRLVPILIVACLVFPLGAIGYQHRVLAEKALQFSTLAGIELVSSLLGFAGALGGGVSGLGVWAIVVGMLVNVGSMSLLAWLTLSSGWRPGWHCRLAECWPYLRFGGYAIGESLANMVRTQADVFVGGLLFAPAALGLYSVPRDLSRRIGRVINPIVTRVGFPVMSKVQGDKERLKSIYLATMRMTASVNFPVYMTLAIFAREAVVLLLGSQWEESAVYLRIFAVIGLVRSTGNPVGGLLYAVGRPRLAFGWNMVLLVVVPPLFVGGALLDGLRGIAWSMLVVQLGVFVPAWRFLVYPLCGAGLREYVGELLPPLLISLAAGACAYAAVTSIEQGGARLAVGLAVEAAVYLVLSIKFNRTWVDSIQELLGFNKGKRWVF